jgi:hypothetical protein
MNHYFIEVTDVYGGEANYSWVTRHVIRGKSKRGAINRFSRLSGISWNHVGCDRYDSRSGATCLFIEEADDSRTYTLQTDDRRQ